MAHPAGHQLEYRIRAVLKRFPAKHVDEFRFQDAFSLSASF
jgi:hypothetical protein